MRKIRRKREKRKKKIIIVSVFLFLIIMTSSYAAFQTNITLKVKGNIIPNCKIGEITINTVTEGDGLYKDEYENEKCIYKGRYPDNYIMFNEELWRIISKESDGTYMIIKNAGLEAMAFDEGVGARWADPSSLNTYLNGDYYDSLTSTAKDQMTSHVFYAGDIVDSNDDLATQIEDEKKTEWYGNVGLVSISDYIKTFSDDELCGNFKLLALNGNSCRVFSWMVNRYWAINGATTTTTSPWSIQQYVIGRQNNAEPWADNVSREYSPRPVVFLKSTIKLTGSGTENDPFILS